MVLQIAPLRPDMLERHTPVEFEAQEVKAFKHLRCTAFACAADAQQALVTFAQGLQATFVAQSNVRSVLRYAKRGRPGQGVPPDQVVYQFEGALAMQLAARQAGIDPQSCFILATNELDATLFSPQELFAGYKGQVQAEQ